MLKWIKNLFKKSKKQKHVDQIKNQTKKVECHINDNNYTVTMPKKSKVKKQKKERSPRSGIPYAVYCFLHDHWKWTWLDADFICKYAWIDNNTLSKNIHHLRKYYNKNIMTDKREWKIFYILIEENDW